MEPFNLETATLQELKAKYYDLLALKQLTENQLNTVNQKIIEKTQAEQARQEQPRPKLLAPKEPQEAI